jgi:predicted RNA-binding protein YlqC (UPF0109 family)
MQGEQGDIVGLVESIVSFLVDETEQVKIESMEEGDTLIIEIHVDDDDIGKIIGRQGRVIKAIRALARAASSYVGGTRVEVEVID